MTQTTRPVQTIDDFDADGARIFCDGCDDMFAGTPESSVDGMMLCTYCRGVYCEA